MTKKINIIQSEKPDQEIPFNILAEHIRDLSMLGKRINASKLKRRTICLLLRDMSNISMKDIDTILNNLPLLEREYLQ